MKKINIKGLQDYKMNGGGEDTEIGGELFVIK